MNLPIKSDDPNAVALLRSKLETLRAVQERMRAGNAIIHSSPKNVSTPEKIAGLVGLGIRETLVAELFKPDFAGRIGFADFEMVNNGANIRRLEKRLEVIVAAEPIVPGHFDGQGWAQNDNVVEQRVMFMFEGKPATDIRDFLKRNGFKWSPTRLAWVRALNANGQAAAARVREFLTSNHLAFGVNHKRAADRVDGYDRDDLGASPDY